MLFSKSDISDIDERVSNVRFPGCFTEDEKALIRECFRKELGGSLGRAVEYEDVYVRCMISHQIKAAEAVPFMTPDNGFVERSLHAIESKFSRALIKMRNERKKIIEENEELEHISVTGPVEYPSIDASKAAVDKDKIEFSDTVASLRNFKLDPKNDVVGLLKEMNKNRSKGIARSISIPALAYFWNCAEDEALEHITYLIKRRGIPLTISNDIVKQIEMNEVDNLSMHVLKIPNVPEIEIPDSNGAMVTRIGVISDTHYGSPACEEKLIQDFYERAYKVGCRVFIHGGDWFDGDGVYKGQENELKYKGFDRQIEHASFAYPRYDDVVTYGIIGNHDEEFIKRLGANPLTHLAMRRNDIRPVGIYQALLNINGFYINIHHGGGGSSQQTPEVTLAKIARPKIDMLRERGIDKLDLCLLGHYHCDGNIQTAWVRKAIFGGGFQNATAFTRRHGFNPYLGGYIASLYRYPDGEHDVKIDSVKFDLPPVSTEEIDYTDYQVNTWGGERECC